MNMKNLNKTDIGLIGLAVMGENLALNMADKGWNVSVYNRTVPGVEEGTAATGETSFLDILYQRFPDSAWNKTVVIKEAGILTLHDR